MPTEQGPLTINDLLNKLKLLPLDWKIQVSNSDGDFYIENIETLDNCVVNLVLKRIP